MFAQFVVTVPQAKQLIARALLQLPEVIAARSKGKIVLKSGTTVSAFAEQLGVPPMRIGGRIVPDGARGAKVMADAPHIAVVEKGQWRRIDDEFPAFVSELTPNDLFVTGANALDAYGGAGLLAGIDNGSAAGKAMSSLVAEGIPTIIAAGLEKRIPGSVADICRQAGRKKVNLSMGMAVGMIPLFGKIITEKEALELLCNVKVIVLAAGGIAGAEGATLMQAEGSEEALQETLTLIRQVQDARTCGNPDSLQSCRTGGPACRVHRACIYSKRQDA